MAGRKTSPPLFQNLPLPNGKMEEEFELEMSSLVGSQDDVIYCPLKLLQKSPLPIIKIDRLVIKLRCSFVL
jgi:hypothetical protein